MVLFLMEEVLKVNELTHVGVIMDGNRRWAKKLGMKSVLIGHEQGVRKLMELCSWCLDRHISFLSVYAFSTENWNRSEAEISGLFLIMEKFFEKELQSCIDQGIRIVVVGDRSRLKEQQRNIIQLAEEKTKVCKSLQVQIAISYGGRNELTRAVRKMLDAVQQGTLRESSITEEVVQEFLDTAGTPMIDMVIRTGGYHRLSNFFVWQTAYSEIYFTDTLWPEFTEKEFADFIEKYQSIHINMGK